MDKGLFSIIVPCYNVEQYVKHCVKKLEEQSYKNYEIILVEDGSTDNTYEECLKLERDNDKIRVFTHQKDEGKARINLGQEATRNRGMEVANGEFILFLDADDYLDNSILSIAHSVFENNEALDFVLGGFCYKISSSGQELNVLADIDEGLYNSDELIKLFHTNLPTNLVSCIGTKIYRSEFLRNHNIVYNKKYKFNEDGAFALETFEYARNVYYVNIPFYYYVQRGGSVTYSYRENAFETVSNRIDLEEKIYRDRGLLEEKAFYISNQRVELIIGLLREEALFKGWKPYCRLFARFYKDDNNRSNCREALREEKGLKRRIRLALFCLKFRFLLYLYYKLISY